MDDMACASEWQIRPNKFIHVRTEAGNSNELIQWSDDGVHCSLLNQLASRYQAQDCDVNDSALSVALGCFLRTD